MRRWLEDLKGDFQDLNLNIIYFHYDVLDHQINWPSVIFYYPRFDAARFENSQALAQGLDIQNNWKEDVNYNKYIQIYMNGYEYARRSISINEIKTKQN